MDYFAVVDIYLKPTANGTVSLTAQVSSNEPDENPSNNTTTQTAQLIVVPKSRKRVRFF